MAEENKIPDHSPKFLALVSQAKSNVQEISVNELLTWKSRNDAYYLIDVREDYEWKKVHIPNTMHLGRGIIERDIESKIPDFNSRIILYCGGGYRSALAACSLMGMGYPNVYSLQGGLRAWISENQPIKSAG